MQKTLTINYQEYSSVQELNAKDRELIEAARKATETSYSPYSRFRVGAAVRLDDGEIVTGSNQENLAYPSGLCAERVALFTASVRAGEKCVVETLGKLVPTFRVTIQTPLAFVMLVGLIRTVRHGHLPIPTITPIQ